MPVFTGAALIRRAVPDPLKDHTLPAPGSLIWGAISGSSALPPTTGQNVQLIQGDWWHEIRGNVTEDVSLDCTTTIKGNVETNILKNQTETVGMHNNLNVMGNHIVFNSGPLDTTTLGKESTQNGDSQSNEDKTDLYETKFFDGKVASIDQENTGLKVETVMYGFALQEYKLEVVDVETKVEETKTGAHVLKAESGGVGQFLEAFRAHVTGAKAEAAGGRAHAGASVSGPPTSLGGN